jgi:hypothetical protein
MSWTLRALTILIAALSAQPSAAWLAETRVEMTGEAVRLMPGSLAAALRSHHDELLEGLLMPMTEDGPQRLPPWRGGSLEQSLAAEVHGLRTVLDSPTPFGEVAERFGRLAHLVLDASFPPGMSRSDGALRYEHYAAFCESRRERFPLVFYGHAEPRLDQGDVAGFALEIMRRAARDDGELARAYAAAGAPPAEAAFDDRSVPFAIGSLAYSHAINDIVRVWLDAWSGGGGDLTRTPYLDRGRREAGPGER